MKKFFALFLAVLMVFAIAACEKEDPNAAALVKSEGVMTYAEYDAAALDTQVVIEAYIQGFQAYSEQYGNISLYMQDPDGAYFVYRMACTAEDAAKMVKGAKVKVTGYKAAWSGEVEITDATYEIMEGTWIAEATDVTALLGNEAELLKNQNKYVTFKGMTVEAANDAGAAYLYKWDGSGQDGDELYFNVSLNGTTYSFTVETDLCDASSEVYAAVKNLKVGDKIDLEGFLYWYEGINPHITAVKAAQ